MVAAMDDERPTPLMKKNVEPKTTVFRPAEHWVDPDIPTPTRQPRNLRELYLVALVVVWLLTVFVAFVLGMLI